MLSMRRADGRDLGVAERLDQPEVEERHLPAGPEQVVARVRIAVEELQSVEAAEHEPEDRLGREVLLLLRPRLGLGEAHAFGELGREHPLRTSTRGAPPGCG